MQINQTFLKTLCCSQTYMHPAALPNDHNILEMWAVMTRF